LYAVPNKIKKETEESKQNTEKPLEEAVQITNESGHVNGKFGWCVSCREPASRCCKHTRYPVCSFECKQRFVKLLEDAETSYEANL
jgi:hypothetical protein